MSVIKVLGDGWTIETRLVDERIQLVFRGRSRASVGSTALGWGEVTITASGTPLAHVKALIEAWEARQ